MNDLCIANKWQKGSGEKVVSLDPATEEVIWEGTGAGQNQVRLAVTEAQKAFKDWSNLSITRRIEYLESFRKKLQENREELTRFIACETGKPLWEAGSEVNAMTNKVSVSFDAFDDRCKTIQKEVKGAIFKTRFEPHGVIAVLGPFNFPGHLPNGHIVPALLAGNTVVFKPSELTPLIGQKMMELWIESGLPKGVINLVQGERATGQTLVNHPDIKGLFFTGSFETGKKIHEQLAGHPEKILALEMGGNNPLVIDEISKIREAAYFTILSAFITSGQRCTCARRLIVYKGKQGDKFLNELINFSAGIRVGAYSDEPEPFMGPLISANALERVLAFSKDLEKKGGRFLLKPKARGGKGFFVTPGIMDVTQIKAREDIEIFAPFLQVIRVKNFDEALDEANNTAFGLSAALFSDRAENFEKFYLNIRAGIINFNRQTTGASSSQPFGGTGRSGNHRPSAYLAADYCSYPTASIEEAGLAMDEKPVPGLAFQ